MEEILKYLFMFVEPLVTNLGHFGVFLGMVLESACIPIPSELILPFAGFLVWQGKLNFWMAILAGTLGNLVGSFLAYWVGIKGGKPFVLKYGRYFFVSPKDFERAEARFNKYGESIIFISRMLPIIRTFISLPAGVAGMNLSRFLAYTFVGSLPWCILFISVGRSLGEHWRDISPLFHKLDFVSIGIIALLIIFLAYKKLKNREKH